MNEHLYIIVSYSLDLVLERESQLIYCSVRSVNVSAWIYVKLPKRNGGLKE